MNIYVDDPRIGLIGDLHIGNNEHQHHYVSYQFKSLEYHLQQISQVTKTIVFLGDILHNRKFATQVTMKHLRRFENLLEEYGINPIFISGNHDVYYKSTNELCSMEFLLDKEGYELIINEVVEIIHKDKPLAALVPWMNKNNTEDLMKQFKASKAPYLFGHFELAGFDLLPGIKSLHSQFCTDEVLKFREVISGHYHCGSRQQNIHYLGTPYEMNWSDSENIKNTMILNMSTGEESLIRNPYTFFDKIHVMDEDLPEIENYRNKNVKVLLNVARTIPIENWINDLTEITNNCNIIDNYSLSESSDAELNITKRMSITDIFTEFMNEQTKYTDSEKTELTKIFSETYNAVLMEDIK